MLKDITGQLFGRLTVLKFMYVKKENAYFLCKCLCGNEKVIMGKSLRSGLTKSCGCIKIELQTKKHTTHGLSRSRFYKCWHKMMNRCFNINDDSYPLYGGRDITVCERWQTFENFRDDRYQSYLDFAFIHGEENTSSERPDVNGNYEPSNHKWATPTEQQRNKRNSARTENYDANEYWKRRLTSLISICLRYNIKKSKLLEPYLGCTPEEFRAHLKSLWEPWMNWSNRGPVRKDKKRWQVDHITSCFMFDLSKEEDRKVCFNYKNLRPYDSLKNCSETARFVTI